MDPGLLKVFLKNYLRKKPTCHACGTQESGIFLCGAHCGLGAYCSEHCQLEMWENLHKTLCDIGIKTKRGRQGVEEDRNPVAIQRAKTDEKFRLLEKLLANKDLASLVLGTIAQANDITLADVYRFAGSSKIVQAAIRRWPKFWYMVWKYKLSSDFRDDGAPNYDQSVKYRQVVFEALFPFTVRIEVVSQRNIIAYSGSHSFRLKITRDDVVLLLESLEMGDDEDLLEIITQDHLDGSFVLRHQQDVVVDEAHIVFKLEPRLGEKDTKLNITAVFIAPRVDITFRNNNIYTEPLLTHTVNFGIYSERRKEVRDVLKLERKIVMRKLERTSRELIRDQPWSAFFQVGTTSWPFTLDGNGKGEGELDEGKVITKLFSELLQTIEDFEELDIVSEVVEEFGNGVEQLVLEGVVLANDIGGF